MDIRQQKEKLRKELLNSRKAVSQEEFESNSEEIINRLQQEPQFLEAETIHCYVSMNGRREVDTHGLIKEQLSKDKEIVVPVTNFNDGTLTNISIPAFNALNENKWGVLEPEEGEHIATDEIELVIVPMVGGDEQCNRIGYGKGFYDRFLKEVSCPTIGLLFEQNIISKVPIEDFDIPLDKIITEQRIISRK